MRRRPAQRERLGVLKSSAESLLHVLNDLLDFSKMEAGKLTLDAVPFHLADEVGATLKWLALQAHTKGLHLSYAQDPACRPSWSATRTGCGRFW